MTYLQEAKQRARRRRSAWNLVLIPAVLLPFGLLVWGLIHVLQLVHEARYPTQHLTADAPGFGPIAMTIGVLFAAFPMSLLVGNGLVWLIGPARRALEREANAVPGTDFVTTQRQGIRLALMLVPGFLAIAVVGAVVSWSVQ